MSHLEKLAETILKQKDKSQVKALLKSLLTPAELEEIPKRLQIISMLDRGVPQRQIAKKLNVSIGTISRGSRELQYGNAKKWWNSDLIV